MSNIKELIRREIERRNLANYCGTAEQYEEELFAFLDTLLDEPVTDCHDLKEAAEKYADGPECSWVGTSALELAFIAGADWMKAKMMEGAVEGEVCGRVHDHINIRFADGVCKYLEPKNISHIPADVSKYNIGQKVRIIILPKEDEQ